ncbi:MAG: putative DNA repair protein MutK [Alteromonadaceae bacterium]|jgi:predicted DNA repair protein MutK
MAGSSLLALIDDIATVLDDVALMAKVAAKKTTGVLGDDIALNAEQVSGVRAERELPVVWAVAKGSAKNKLILVPTAILISAVIPWLITPLLMIGGLYLCYEGFEKIAHKLMRSNAQERKEHAEQLAAICQPDVDLVVFEAKKINGAIRTDFILSAEIIVIALGTVATATLAKQAMVVSLIAVIMTIGVYGLVAAIVKLDDAGFYLVKDQAKSSWAGFKRFCGRAILAFAPFLMKSLAFIGTVAMFMVGGGILIHGVPDSHNFFVQAQELVGAIPAIGNELAVVTPTILNTMAGVIAGVLSLLVVNISSLIYLNFKHPKQASDEQ